MPDELIDLPEFAKDVVRHTPCSMCGLHVTPEDVCMHGIRRGKDGRTYYCYEIQCPHCDQPSATLVKGRRMNSRGLYLKLEEKYGVGASAMPEGYAAEEKIEEQVTQEAQSSITHEVSGITDEEVAAALKVINEATNFEDVLSGLGITKAQMEEWRKKYAEPDDESKRL